MCFLVFSELKKHLTTSKIQKPSQLTYKGISGPFQPREPGGSTSPTVPPVVQDFIVTDPPYGVRVRGWWDGWVGEG